MSAPGKAALCPSIPKPGWDPGCRKTLRLRLRPLIAGLLAFVLVVLVLCLAGLSRARRTCEERVTPRAPPGYPFLREPLTQRLAAPGDMKRVADRWTNCSQGIYVDVGTNYGTQIRKLYSPKQFPGAAVLPLFDKYFGRNRTGVCAVGFEPNPKHVKHLDLLNAWFLWKDLRAFVFTETAASVARDPEATFFRDFSRDNEWGATLFQGSLSKDTNVREAAVKVHVVDLVDFLDRVVRRVVAAEEARSGRRPPVLMKVDAEGAEYAVVPALLTSGMLCDVDGVFVEWHKRARGTPKEGTFAGDEKRFKQLLAQMVPLPSRCHMNLMDLDDESYGDEIVNMPLP